MNVESIRRDSQFSHAGNRLRGKRFIDFEQINVGNFSTGLLEQSLDRAHRS